MVKSVEECRALILRNARKICFDPQAHRYWVKGSQPRLYLPSMTTALKIVEEEKDWDLIAWCSAKKRGMTKRAVQLEWDMKRFTGSDVHKYLELLFDFQDTKDFLFSFAEDAWFWKYKSSVEAYIKSFGNKRPIYLIETAISSVESRIAGTPDKILFYPETNKIVVRDYKTDVDFKKSYGKFLSPLNHLLNNGANKYALQMHGYGFMIESIIGRVPDLYQIVHILPHKYEIIDVIDRSIEADALLRKHRRIVLEQQKATAN